ncbi:hypothetical protein ACFWWB_37925 [Streptomyces sp. NPDC058690]|uniref:hypothetical protein n=1 Tax=Streptomyces sp. NPDC058690 TaxID=3346600 RepID=UPI00365B7E4A
MHAKEIQAAEFMSYYQHRYVKTTLSTDSSAVLNPALVPAGQVLYAPNLSGRRTGARRKLMEVERPPRST